MKIKNTINIKVLGTSKKVSYKPESFFKPMKKISTKLKWI